MVEGVDVDVVKHTFERIVFRVPQTGIQGKFCMPYLVARALIDGKVALRYFHRQRRAGSERFEARRASADETRITI